MFGGVRRGKRGWGAAGKIIVLGILQRNGKVKVFAVPARTEQNLISLVHSHTKPGSLYYTDDWHAYGSLRLQGDHVVVRKEKGCPKGRDHLNGIEGFWSYAKERIIKHHGVTPQRFPFYLKELEFRYNHRKEDIFSLITKFLCDLVPKRR